MDSCLIVRCQTSARVWLLEFFGFSVVRGKEILDHFKARCCLLDMRHVAGLRENRPAHVGDPICEGLDYRFGGLIVAARDQQGGGVDTAKPIDD